MESGIGWAAIWGAHAPSRAGDDALVIANFEEPVRKIRLAITAKVHCGEGAAISTRGACAPQAGTFLAAAHLRYVRIAVWG